MKIGILDDDLEFSVLLEKRLKKDFKDALITVCYDEEPNVFYDLLFCDICLKKHSGIDIADAYTKKYPLAHVVFISSLEQSIFNAQRVKSVCFIRKSHFEEDYALFLELYKRTIHFISFKHKNNVIKIDIDDIVSIESRDHYIVVRTFEKSYCFRMPLYKIENQMNGFPQFIRVNQSFIVNADFIYCVHSDVYMLDDRIENRISITRKYRKQFMEKYEAYLKNDTV